MSSTEETQQRLAEIPNLTVLTDAPLSRYTRFGIGGPADIFAETESVDAFVAALTSAHSSGSPVMVIGGGTNLVVSDNGFRGVVLRYRASRLTADGTRVVADAGAVLQDLVDFTVDAGLQRTGDAGRYSRLGGRRSLRQRRRLRPLHFRARGERAFLRWPAQCVSSITPLRIPLSRKHLQTPQGVDYFLHRAACSSRRCPCAAQDCGRYRQGPQRKVSGHHEVRRQHLQESASHRTSTPRGGTSARNSVREGKIPAAWFLEQAGAKGLQRGDIHVATYHANLIYNAGDGTASDLRAVIQELKLRVRDRFGIEIEEEVQYVGWD